MCVCVCAKRSHTHVKDPVVHACQSSVESRNTKITLHAVKVSVFRMLKLNTTQKKKKKKKKKRRQCLEIYT